MKKILFLIINILLLSACAYQKEPCLNNTYFIENEEYYEFGFHLEYPYENEANYSITLEIKSNYNILYYEEIDFIGSMEQEEKLSFLIYKDEISLSSISFGTLNCYIDWYYDSYHSYELNNLEVGDVDIHPIVNLLEETSTTTSKDKLDDKLKVVYDEINNKLKNYMLNGMDYKRYPFTDFDFYEYRLFEDEVLLAYEAVLQDNPLYYYISDYYYVVYRTYQDVYYISDLVLFVKQNYYYNDRIEINNKIVSFIEECNTLTNNLNDIEKLTVLYNKIIELDNYDLNKVYYILLNYYNFNNVYIQCERNNKLNYINLIEIDNLYYYIDLDYNEFCIGSNSFNENYLLEDNYNLTISEEDLIIKSL